MPFTHLDTFHPSGRVWQREKGPKVSLWKADSCLVSVTDFPMTSFLPQCVCVCVCVFVSCSQECVSLPGGGYLSQRVYPSQFACLCVCLSMHFCLSVIVCLSLCVCVSLSVCE